MPAASLRGQVARYVRACLRRLPGGYARRLSAEKSSYAGVQAVHELPGIFHYWSNRHLLPRLREFGFSSEVDLYASQLEVSLKSGRLISIGAGNCDVEARVAERLRSRGHTDFVIECLEVNAAMLRRGRALAAEKGLSAHRAFVEGDFNTWQPRGTYDAVLANQSLHHVVRLEHLIDAIAAAIGAEGRFVTADLIGRNGHQRWPEALAIVRELWRERPPPYRDNRQLARQEDEVHAWGCSGEGVEGVRAQDILPLLVERFHFELFVPFGNVIDPFIDRSFGPNFDRESERDRAFIDRVQAIDEQAMLEGRIKPTHMFAVLRNPGPWPRRFPPGLPPENCVRIP
jgi:SAM-dependent methyltransferase